MKFSYKTYIQMNCNVPQCKTYESKIKQKKGEKSRKTYQLVGIQKLNEYIENLYTVI